MPEPQPDEQSQPRPHGPDGQTPQAATGRGNVHRSRAAARQRLADAFRRPSRGQALVGVLLAGLGFAGVTQVRSNDLDHTYAGKRQQDLIDLLSSLSVASQRSQREIAGLEETREELSQTSSRRQAAITAAEQAAANLQILAGTVPVSGPGIRVTITESDGAIDLNNVLDTVQELRTAQAEAMEFNDSVRAVAATSFSETESGVVVNGQQLASPYVIEVIGDPNTLDEGLQFPDGPIAKMRDDDGAEVTIEQVEDLEIDSVVDAVEPDYAQPGENQ